MTLKAPFPWFGGKSRVAHLVWERFGDVPNYVEPFAGSIAVLLARPTPPGTETVNDLDCYLANFWRSVRENPTAVAAFADWPVNEADLHARHKWLVGLETFRERMKSDPDFYDARVAGWWVWGICQWIGSGWCSRPEWTGRAKVYGASRGIEQAGLRRDGAPPEQLPHMGNAGRGLHRKLPHMGNAGRDRYLAIESWMVALADRLRNVRVACGNWDRILGGSSTFRHGATGVFLDPPYSAEHSVEYAAHTDVAQEVAAWARENGDNPSLRIALCGYEGEHAMPDSWECLAWKARGGYGSQGNGVGRENARKERIWFSPACKRTRLIA